MFTKEIENKFAISVSKNFLLDLENILKAYFQNIYCIATLKNEDRMNFETITDLCEYENALERRIVKLEISAYSEKQESIHLFFEEKEKTSVRGVVSTRDSDVTDTIYKKVDYAIRRKDEDIVFSMLARTGYSNILCIISLIIVIFELFCNKNAKEMDLSPQHVIIYVELILIYMVCVWGLYKIKKYFFPIIVFNLGDEMKKSEKRENLKRNLLWGVFVAFVITIIGSVVYAKLTEK